MTEHEELLMLRALVAKQAQELEASKRIITERDEKIRKQNIQIDNMIQALLHARKKLFGPSTEVTQEVIGVRHRKFFKKLTGKVSDVTARFYEAMACKTLIIGYKPDTFDELFYKDAMVDLDDVGKEFDEVIEFFEKYPEKYKYIVNRNYELLLKKHTWKSRYDVILKAFQNIVDKVEDV